MKKKFVIAAVFSAIVILTLVSANNAQTKREILTNAKIIELVRLGLGEEIIVEKIRQSECQCDTSADGLAKLKAAKVPNTIIMAMLNATSENKSYSENTTENNSSKNAPTNSVETNGAGSQFLSQITEPGIYLFENGKLTMIEPTIYSGTKSSFLGTALTYGIKKAKIRAVVRGKSANLRVASARPEFYFVFSREYGNSGAVMAGSFYGYGATSPAEFMMIEMKVKENSREAIIGEANAFSASTGTPDKYIREFSFEKIKPGVFKVVPKIDLAVGEYCFYYAGAGGAASKVFDFGVKGSL